MNDQPPGPLPVLAIIREAFAIIWRKRAIMFRALLPASLILIVGLQPLKPELLKKMLQSAGPFAVLSLLMAVVVLIWVVYAIFQVTCHRLVLLGEGSLSECGLITWSPRETRFIGWGLLALLGLVGTMLLVGIVIVPLGLIFGLGLDLPPELVGVILATLLLLPGVYVFARLSILLPATAVDERPSIKWAVDVTNGNGWRLVLIIGIFPVALGLVPGRFEGYSVVSDVLIGAVQCVLFAIETAAISLSYRHLTGREVHSSDKSEDIATNYTRAAS